MEEYGSHDGNTHLRSRYSQGVVTPYRPEISDRSIQREQLCFQDYARGLWVASEQPYSVFLS